MSYQLLSRLSQRRPFPQKCGILPILVSLPNAVDAWNWRTCHPVRRFSPCTTVRSNLTESEDIELWISRFSKDSIPREQLEVSFSRSSGPGGQNVNKVNTKVDMRFPIKYAQWLPPEVKAKLREQNANRINKKLEFVVSSDRHRNQHQNFEECLSKLYTAIVEAAEELVPRGPSEETLKRIEEFKEIEREKKMKAKERHAQKKASRRRGKDDY
ncbi:uncharacterized protein SPPG_04139 [Spizellomyces punctatus DAOM BR117]|uniref:Prokaryotic-type class I peptide chain release factors domain-containing protein n=1 Tax=Spizellomyces punctatus (strain DAOM BR117) TaxID=645134 RepID=A0A0L0HHV7_SPIPD|nr:uncharacterized protein SPPG_04139 [Spizellomyces punctatus DAOM BR117]KND01046.1 hypothetical protein SPPG_04139 [Spizellomyces punctatus DAOM BR117]|eukprot:XP_016609085.1 hypothetical protein SPPG_04139 [Spizellomyces punctatus DAOM BR117]